MDTLTRNVLSFVCVVTAAVIFEKNLTIIDFFGISYNGDIRSTKMILCTRSVKFFVVQGVYPQSTQLLALLNALFFSALGLRKLKTKNVLRNRAAPPEKWGSQPASAR